MKSIETERCILRKLTQTDADRIEELASDYDVAKTTLNIPHPYPKGGAKDFIERTILAEVDGKSVTYAIVKKRTNQLIGIIGIKLTPTHKRGELGYWIGKPDWGRGYGTEATKAIVTLGFETLHLHKIFSRAITTNPGSWRIMVKVGMTHEGTLKQHAARRGQFVDLVYYGILKEEYEQRLKK